MPEDAQLHNLLGSASISAVLSSQIPMIIYPIEQCPFLHLSFFLAFLPLFPSALSHLFLLPFPSFSDAFYSKSLRSSACYTFSFTNGAAQGGGGSFKDRKPIGEVGCCESGMAERIQAVFFWSGCNGCSGHLTHNCWMSRGVTQL